MPRNRRNGLRSLVTVRLGFFPPCGGHLPVQQLAQSASLSGSGRSRIFVGLCGLAPLPNAFATGQRHQTLRTGPRIPCVRGWLRRNNADSAVLSPFKKCQTATSSAKKSLRHDPTGRQPNSTTRDHRLQRAKAVFGAHHSHLQPAELFQQERCAPCMRQSPQEHNEFLIQVTQSIKSGSSSSRRQVRCCSMSVRRLASVARIAHRRSQIGHGPGPRAQGFHLRPAPSSRAPARIASFAHGTEMASASSPSRGATDARPTVVLKKPPNTAPSASGRRGTCRCKRRASHIAKSGLRRLAP